MQFQLFSVPIPKRTPPYWIPFQLQQTLLGAILSRQAAFGATTPDIKLVPFHQRPCQYQVLAVSLGGLGKHGHLCHMTVHLAVDAKLGFQSLFDWVVFRYVLLSAFKAVGVEEAVISAVKKLLQVKHCVVPLPL
ncbi:hypothetical protein TNCV_653261 [Trichonephila clavipes]|nr:hypothetical protein TNCV_653261 [Trichonephila clavipes]